MPQTPRIPLALWEAQKARITELYVNQDKTLDEVIQIMAEYGFHATECQLEVQKNCTREKWQHASALVTKREAEGKITELSIDGKVISEEKRKKELRRYHVSQVEEEFASNNTCGVVALTPPSSDSKVVLINDLPWLNFRESFNNLINDRYPLFNPNQQDDSLNFWEVINPLLSIAHNDGEMTTGNQALQEPRKPVADLASMRLGITRRRLHELVPILDDSLNICQHQGPPWLKVFNSLVFLCSNNLTRTDVYTCEVLQLAVSSGFLLKMKHLLTMRGPTVEIFAVHILFVALEVEGSKGMEFLRFLLESGVSPDSIDPYNRRCSALHQAVLLDNKVAVELLLTSGADPDAKMQCITEETLKSPLNDAINLLVDKTIAKMLIDAGADVNFGLDKPLIQAARTGDLALMRHMLEVGADPRLLPAGGLLLIYSAVYRHGLSLVNMLIEAGANPNLSTDELQDTEIEFLGDEFNFYYGGRILTPIQLAVLQGDAEIVKGLIEGGAVLDRFIDPEILKKMGKALSSFGLLTPLQISVEQNQGEITEILLDAGAAIDFRHPATATALQLACHLPAREQKKTGLIEVLFSRGADINALPGEDGGRTTIQAAAECGDHDLLKLLLSKGGDPFASASEKNGITVFQAALKSGSVELVDYVFWEFGSQGGSVHYLDGTNYLVEAVSTGDLQLLDTVLMSWNRLGLHWPEEYILSAVKVAIRKGLIHLVEFLDPGLSSILQKDASSMICECIWSGDQRTFDLLMQRSVKTNLDCAQPGYLIPLWLAMHEGKRYMAQRLIDAGANPNQQSLAICRKRCCCDTRLEMPLKQAIRQFDSKFIEILTDKGADIHCLIDGSQTPLLVSLERKNESAAVFFLSKGADPNAVGLLDERTALGLALDQKVSLSTVQLLIHYGSDVNRPSTWGTPLEQVVRGAFWYNDALQRCQLLLTAGADVNASTGRTALQLAVDSDRLDLVMLLIEVGADVNASGTGMTALQAAVCSIDNVLAKVLIDAGANINTSSTGYSALQLAIASKNLELTKLFVQEGADINASALGETALQTAAKFRSLELVKYLIDKGADVNAKTFDYRATALQYAAMHGNIKIVKYLIEHGASVNEEASPGYNATALGLAISHYHTQAALFLIENGASIDKCPAADDATTLLQFAMKYGNHEIVTCLAENGAEVNAPPAAQRGATALQSAAINGNIKMAVFLLENGALVSAEGAEVDGRTALEGAAEHGRLDMVYLLLENDEEPDTIEERCRNAAEFAEAEHHNVIARILRDYKRP